MVLSRRWNKFWIGFVVGIILPTIIFLLIYLIGYSEASFVDFVKYSSLIRALPKILSLCIVPNLAVFYFFLNKEFWKSTKGIITATLLCTLAILAIKFFV